MKKTILALSIMTALVACGPAETTEPATTTDSTEVVTDSTKVDSTVVEEKEVK